MTRTQIYLAAGLALALTLPQHGFGQVQSSQQQQKQQQKQQQEQQQERLQRQRQQQQLEQQERQQQQDREQVQQQRESQNASNPQANDEKSEPETLKIIQLKHVAPTQLMQLLQRSGQIGHTTAYRGYQRFGTRQTVAPSQNTLKISALDEANRIFIRGTEKQVNMVTELVDRFDRAEISEAAEVGDGYYIPLKHDNSNEVISILRQLQLPGDTVQVGDTSFIIIPKDAEERSQTEKVVNEVQQLSDDRKKRESEQRAQSEKSADQEKQDSQQVQGSDSVRENSAR